MQAALRSLISISLIGGAALYVCPRNGTKQILKLLITAILTAAVLAPLRKLDYDRLNLEEAKLGSAEAKILQDSRQRENSLQAQFFIQNCESYIRSHGEAMGLRVQHVRVEAIRAEDTGLQPYSVYLEIAGDPETMEQLCQMIRDELGIPVERQVWSAHE